MASRSGRTEDATSGSGCPWCRRVRRRRRFRRRRLRRWRLRRRQWQHGGRWRRQQDGWRLRRWPWHGRRRGGHLGRGRWACGRRGQRPARKRRHEHRRLRHLRRRHQHHRLHRRRWHWHNASRHVHHGRRRWLRRRRLQRGWGRVHGRRGVLCRRWHDDVRRWRRWRLDHRDHLQVRRSRPGRHPVRHAEAQDLLRTCRLPRGARLGCRRHCHGPRHPFDDHKDAFRFHDSCGSDRRPAAAAGADDHDAGAPEDVHVLGRPPLGDF
mmetsp:Transcript_99844/g.287048  ORF Transcript_99844/g.287048 Transcript_99844/m.287048 type:complete len:266 (-) Transcript_99844:568-1365(-)